MRVMVWFYNHMDTLERLMRQLITEKRKDKGQDGDEDDEVSSCAFYNLKTLGIKDVVKNRQEDGILCFPLTLGQFFLYIHTNNNNHLRTTTLFI